MARKTLSDISPLVVAGRINANGTIAAGTGFTITRPSTGNYNITITIPGFVLLAPIAVLSSSVNNPSVVTTYTSSTVFAVGTFVPGVMTDMAFSFVAYGAP